jgi:hypothetical protein
MNHIIPLGELMVPLVCSRYSFISASYMTSVLFMKKHLFLKMPCVALNVHSVYYYIHDIFEKNEHPCHHWDTVLCSKHTTGSIYPNGY